MRRIYMVGALAAFGLACEDDGVAPRIDALWELVDEQFAIQCDCVDASTPLCEGERELPADYKGCFVDALADDPRTDAYLDCALRVEGAYNACLMRAQCDFDPPTCREEYERSYDGCNARLSARTLDAVVACALDGATPRLSFARPR